MSASKAQRRAAVERATEIAQRIVERKDIDSDVLEAVASGLETSRDLLEGHRESSDLDAEVAEVLHEAIGTVERGNLLWGRHLEIAEEVLRVLQPDEREALIEHTDWADDDVLQSLPTPNRETWEEAAVPVLALSATEIDEPADPQGLILSEAQSGNEPAEVVEAELVDEPEEVGQTTSSQRRFKMPAGRSYVPPRRFGDTLGSRDPRARERAAVQARFGGDTFIEGD